MTRVFAAPAAIAAFSAFGLIAAFVFGDLGRVLCWLGLGAPIAVIGWYTLRRAT